MKIYILLPIYHGTEIADLKACVESFYFNLPEDIKLVICLDGKVKQEVAIYLATFEGLPSVFFHVSDKNQGLSKILNAAIQEFKADWYIRMDSDDVMSAYRLERQLTLIKSNRFDVVGGEVLEHRAGKAIHRKMPHTHDEIASFAYFRNPIVHPSVAFRADSFHKAGGYRDLQFFEDYDLWLRMLNSGARFFNDSEVYVEMTFADSDVERRRGMRYVKCEVRFYIDQYLNGRMNLKHLLYGFLLRIPTRLLPLSLFKILYRISRFVAT